MLRFPLRRVAMYFLLDGIGQGPDLDELSHVEEQVFIVVASFAKGWLDDEERLVAGELRDVQMGARIRGSYVTLMTVRFFVSR